MRPWIKACAFVALLIIADVTVGITPLGSGIPAPWRSDASVLDEYRADIERAWEGGGPAILFADNFSPLTAQQLARAGAGIEDYYGGALAEDRSGADQWSQDLYRWGQGASQGMADAWALGAGGLHFGDADGLAYPAGTMSEFVSPVIDLRHLAPIVEQELHASVPRDPMGPQPPSGVCVNNVPWCQLRENTTAASQRLAPGGNAAVTAPRQASAALSLRHGYDFLLDGDAVADGGRVVVSAFDPATRQWSDWSSLRPTDQALRLGPNEVRVRTDPSGMAPVEADVGMDGGAITGTSTPTGHAIVDDRAGIVLEGGGATIVQAPVDRDAHLYQGTVESSGPKGSRWQGFRGASPGLVDSLFDLTPYGGRLVRIAFQVATAGNDEPMTHGFAGWTLAAVEVNAVLAPDVQLLGLSGPGEDAIVAPGSDLQPILMVQNTGHHPVQVDALVTMDGVTSKRSFQVSVGPLARINVPAAATIQHLAPGMHEVSVALVSKAAEAEAIQGDFSPDPTPEIFRVMAADVTDWQTTGVTFHPVFGTGADREEGNGRLVSRGQHGIVRVNLENVGTNEARVDLGRSQADPGDLRPAIVDESGLERGTMLAATAHLVLPVSRFISGTAGTPQAARTAVWEWTGSDTAQGLHLVVRRTTGQTEAVVEDGGSVLVQTVPADILDVDYRNPWHLGGCVRYAEWEGQAGVIRCEGGETLVSPGRRLFDIDLLRGNETAVLASYTGGPLLATLQSARSATPSEVPPASAAWTDLAVAVLPASLPWTTQRLPMPALPAGFSGHVRLVLDPAAATDIDLIRAEIALRNRAGESVAVPVVAENFDVEVAPAADAVQATASSGLMSLEGTRDPLPPESEAARIETRFLGDGVLSWNGTLDLGGAARPTLSFRHWIDPGFEGAGLVEVRPADQPGSDWKVVARFDQATGGRSTVPTEVALWDLAGQRIEFRFRLHFEATMATARHQPLADWTISENPLFPAVTSAEQGPSPAGWLIEGIEVQAWNELGASVLHAASTGYPGYTVTGGKYAGDRQTMSNVNCWNGPTVVATCRSTRGLSVLATEPFDLRAMTRPQLRVLESAGLRGTKCQALVSFPAVDVEYQQIDRGLPAGRWHPATPTDGALTWRRTTESEAPALLDPNTGLPNGPPYGGNHPAVNGCTDGAGRDEGPISLVGPFNETLARHDFDLGPLQAGSGISRLQLDAWVERARQPSFSGGDEVTEFGNFSVQALHIGDSQHVIDANITGITSSSDDRQRLEALDSQAVASLGLADDLVVANEQVLLRVDVGNPGRADLEVDVTLRGAATAGGGLVDLTWMEEVGKALRPSGLVTGHTKVKAGGSAHVLFQANLREAPPGAYRFTARVDATTGVDTNSRNDLLERNVRVLPFRDLAIDASTVGVQPYASDPAEPRMVRASLRNGGNIEEMEVQVLADIVHITGLTTFEPMGLEPVSLGDTSARLAARGAGRAEVAWNLVPQDLAGGDLQAFVPGEKYAVRLRIAPQPGSVTTWWTPVRLPLAESNDGLGLLNVSRPADAACSCLLAPFIVEKNLYATDLSPAGSRSLFPDLLGVDSLDKILEGWVTQTLLDGVPLSPGVRPDIPRWSVVTAQQTRAVAGGTSTGMDWLLPAYEGLESVQQVLVSPALPAHVVAGDSRSILKLRYGGDVQTGQAVLESRSLIGGQWTSWRPIDDIRSHRVAVILSQDFPRVEPDGVGDLAAQYKPSALREAGHPAPSWYGDPLGRAYIEPGTAGTEDAAPSCKKANRLCFWSPPVTSTVGGNHAWMEALDETLRVLADDIGADNIGLFTTIDGNPELAIGHPGAQALVHTVQVGQTRREFPIQSLDALGVQLDRYGAIILMGDGVTNGTLPEFHSRALDSIAHGPGDTILREASPVAHEHVAKVRAILGAAPAAGIAVFGTLGPAAALMVDSGIAPDATYSIWQTAPAMPYSLLEGRPLKQTLACTAVKPVISEPRWEAPQGGAQHPLDPCRRNDGQTIGGIPDTDDPHNYGLVSPYDAKSAALRELVPKHVLVGSGIYGSTSLGCGVTQHPLLASGSPCKQFATRSNSQANGLQVFSAGFPGSENIRAWAKELTAALGSGRGELPNAGWQDLPPRLAFPFGGRFIRQPDGSDRFDGSPTQMRIVVSSSESLGGHGVLAVDAIGLLGSNRGNDLAVAFVQPRAGAAYAPGRPFDVVLEATNRGGLATEPMTVDVGMSQWLRFSEQQRATCYQAGRDDCEYVVAVPAPALVTVPGLAPGKQVQLHVAPPDHPTTFGGGVFPDCETCPAPALQDNRFNLTASLHWVGANHDEDAGDDAQTITVVGREVVRLDEESVMELHVSPTRAEFDADQPITIEAKLTNLGSSRQTYRMDVAVDHARPLPCDKREDVSRPSDQSLYGCEPGSNQPARPLVLDTPTASMAIERGDQGVLRVTTSARELGVGPGVYRVGVVFKTTDSAARELRYPEGLPLQGVIRLTDGEPWPPEEGDGFLGYEANSLDGLSALPTSPARNDWHPSGFVVSGASSNGGAYAVDPTTTDRSDEGGGRSLRHGWRIADACALCDDRAKTAVEWRRDAPPSYRPGVDEGKWLQSDGTSDDRGSGDFGPDYLTWLPDDTSDRLVDSHREPYLSLASYDLPALSVLTRFVGTGNTSFVVQAQVAARVPCTESGSPPVTSCPDGGGWTWPTEWVTLASDDGSTTIRTLSSSEDGPSKITLPPPAGPQDAWTRRTPSNPLGGLDGLWGGASGRHAEDGGWMPIHYSLTTDSQPDLSNHCHRVAASVTVVGEARRPDRDVCRYAYAPGNGGHGQANSAESYVARPLRFRLAAASYGGDVGESVWQVADLTFGEYRVAFTGPSTIPIRMLDSQTRVFPVRVANQGTVPDTIRVAWTSLPGRDISLGDGGSIGLSLGSSGPWTEGAAGLPMTLQAGDSKVVWVRLRTGIIDALAPGTDWPIPFILRTNSIVSPTAASDLLVDAVFMTRSWPNLEAMHLVVEDDAGLGGFRASVKAPLETTLVFRNTGQLPIGTASPVLARLIAVELDSGTGVDIPGSELVLDEVELEEAILPYGADGHDHYVDFKEWVPNRLGAFRLYGELNVGNPAAAERTHSDNAAGRDVLVGPVRFADLQITDLWVSEFNGECATRPESRITAGHAYCIGARIENHGLLEALEPRIDFGVGSSAPFSAGAPPLTERFDQRAFPAASAAEGFPAATAFSSPRVLHANGNSPGVELYAEVSARSVMPFLDNKTRDVTLPVDVFRLVVTSAPGKVLLVPGLQTRIAFNVTNTGNAGVTPEIAMVEVPAGLWIHLDGARQMLPGESMRLQATITAGLDLGENATLHAIHLTSHEDALLDVPIPLAVDLLEGGAPQVHALSRRLAPGQANLSLLLDAGASPVPFEWRAVGDGSVRPATNWTLATEPFEQAAVDLPILLHDSTRPGPMQARLQLVAEHGGSGLVLNVSVPLEVEPRPSLDAVVLEPVMTSVAGATARMSMRLRNTGNVPVTAQLSHFADVAVSPGSQNITIPVTEERNVTFTAAATPFDRVLGSTVIEWTTPGGRNGTAKIDWQVVSADARVQILKTDLSRLHPRAGHAGQASVTVTNAGTAAFDAEVLLAADSRLQTVRTVHLASGESREVILPFTALKAGTATTFTVVARPAGSDAWLPDALLYTIGDVEEARIDVRSARQLPIPGVPFSMTLVALALLALGRRQK